MSRKKKKKQNAVQSPSEPALPATPRPAGLPTADEFSRQMSFDSLEDRIRGEEMLQDQENKKLKEAQDIKKNLDSAEVDRRMEELRKQLGLKNDLPRRKK